MPMTVFLRPRRWALAGLATVVLGCLGLACGAGVAAANERDSGFSAGFSTNTHLGEGGSFSAGVFLSGTEYHGQVAPLTGLTLRLPEGIGFSSSGFATCSKETLEDFGPVKCPTESVAGPIGSMRAVVWLPEAEEEEAEVTPYFGPGGVVYFYVDGHSPVSLETVIEGHFVSDVAPYGQSLVLDVPLMQQSPTSPDVSITDLTLNLGTLWEVAGHEAWSLTLPTTCTSSFAWAADASFNGEASEPVGMPDATACAPSGTRLSTITTVSASNLAPAEEAPVTYTATVTPSSGPAPAGTVAFLGGCTAQPLISGIGSSTATCLEHYSDPGDYEVRGYYSGSATDAPSLSHLVTVTVHLGTEEQPASKEEVSSHETTTTNGGSSSSNSAGGSSPTGSGSGVPVPVATISSAQLSASLSQQLAPSGKVATIGALLNHGGLSLNVKALEAGTLTVQWFSTAQGAKTAKTRSVLVAMGKVVFTGAGTGKLVLRLTVAGKRLLKGHKRVSVKAKGTFTANQQTAVTASRGFVVRG